VAVKNTVPYFFGEVFKQYEIQSGGDVVAQRECRDQTERVKICYTQTGDPPYMVNEDTFIALSPTTPTGVCPDQKTTRKKLLMDGRLELIKEGVGINFIPSPPLLTTIWYSMMVNLGENPESNKAEVRARQKWEQGKG
jgi:hypothetical protein